MEQYKDSIKLLNGKPKHKQKKKKFGTIESVAQMSTISRNFDSTCKADTNTIAGNVKDVTAMPHFGIV